ncbi:hypothetical protein OROGR_005996 [Orobanche gracilis]
METRTSKRKKGKAVESSSTPIDGPQFRNAQSSKVFHEILINEEVTPSHHFDFESLKSVGIRLDEFFDFLGITKFVGSTRPIYVDCVREFYANFWTSQTDENAYVVHSSVRGKEIEINAAKLHSLFELPNDGIVCTGHFASSDDIAMIDELDDVVPLKEMDVRDFLMSKAVLEIHSDRFENNDFGLKIRLFHDAITRSLMPKVNAQSRLVNIDMEILYHVLKDEDVNFSKIVLKWLVEKGQIFHKKGYANSNRQRKSGMPFGSILTVVFENAGVDLSRLHCIPISRGCMVHEGTIRSMRYLQTRNRGWIYFAYIKDEDTLVDGSSLPRSEDRISVRGSQTERPRMRTHATPQVSSQASKGSTSSNMEMRMDRLESDMRDIKLMVQNICSHFGIPPPPPPFADVD